MNKLLEKFRLIYKPFLLIAISIILGYTLLNWLLFIKMHLPSPNEEVINLWIPLALPWIPLLVWLMPRIKLLNLKQKKGDLVGLYIMIAGIAIAVPTVIAQEYLETATGKLTNLENISSIDKKPITKYYAIKNFYLDKKYVGVKNSFEVSGKHNEDFNMKLFVALPLLNSADDTSSSNCKAWYGVKYFKSISNRIDVNEKEEAYKKFLSESQEDFDNKNFNDFIYLDNIANNDDRRGYAAAIENNKRYSANSKIILLPINEPFEARNGKKFPWIFWSFAIGALVWLTMILIPALNTSAVEKFNNGDFVKQKSFKEIFSFFIPSKDFYITPILMDINILVFIIMVLSGLGFISFQAEDLLKWGANFKPYTARGEWWRLLTSVFLHGGLMHLLANMYGLLFVGIFLEPKLGRVRYAWIYIGTGIFASIASLWWHEATVSVGASGAIFGLYGVFLALLLTKAFPQDFNKAFLTSTLIFIGYNLIAGLGGGIDNAAHIGGLVSGFVVGIILNPYLKKEQEEFQLSAENDNADNSVEEG